MQFTKKLGQLQYCIVKQKNLRLKIEHLRHYHSFKLLHLYIYIYIYICIYIRFEDVFLERHKRLIVSEAD